MHRGTREYTVWTVIIVAVVLAALVPVLWIVSLSLKSPANIADGSFIPRGITLDNYTQLFDGGLDSPLLRPLINSLLIALIATTIAVTLASFTAYAIARLEFPGKFLILAGALAIAMFPPISVVGPLFDMWRNIGLFDTWQGLVIPYMTFTLPLLKPALLVALLFRTLDAFRVFDSIFVMTRGAQDTESVSILGYNQLISRLNLGLGSAVSVLIFLIVLFIAFLFVKGFGTTVPGQGDDK